MAKNFHGLVAPSLRIVVFIFLLMISEVSLDLTYFIEMGMALFLN